METIHDKPLIHWSVFVYWTTYVVGTCHYIGKMNGMGDKMKRDGLVGTNKREKNTINNGEKYILLTRK